MSFIYAFSWWQWAILAIIPPLVILLYFLKLRRAPLQVPSTFLWARTVEDLHVNSIWQKLRNNLLLWLQLLCLILLLLCGLRPGCKGDQLVGERFIFLVDNSASMAATDMGSKSRLELAKEKVETMIDLMKPGDVAMIISFSDSSYPIQSYTSNKSLLKARLSEIRQTERRTDLREALLAASGLANPGRTSNRDDNRDYQVADAREATLMIVSDGGVRNVPDFSMIGLTPEYHAIGGVEAPDNVGIIAFAVSANTEKEGVYQAFARIENFSDQDKSVGVSIYANGELFDSQGDIQIKANQTTGISFDLEGSIESMPLPIELKMVIDRDDDLAIDNTAFTILNKPRQARVLVITDGNRFLEFAMLTEQNKKIASIEFEPPSFLEAEAYKSEVMTGAYDLVIYDRVLPESNPPCNTFYINVAPPDDRWELTKPISPVSILDYSRSHPIMQYVTMGKIVIIEASSVEKSPSATIALIESPSGPLMAIGPRDGFQDCVLAFPIVSTGTDGSDQLNTDWPNQLSFPLMIQNLISYLGGVSELKTDQNSRTGDILQLKMDEHYREIRIQPPVGEKSTVRRNPNNVFVFADTNRIGVYDISGKEDPAVNEKIAVNLMDRRESDIRVREKLEIGFEEIAKTDGKQKVRREWWKWLVGAALVVLLLEWVIYNRRIFM